ncbi:MAG: GIY-YIG nuclease family protein [Myxococcota bacterium]
MRATFDRKFGVARVAELPTTPGVYLFRDADEVVVYVGKAKNLRRRLATYRNASRRKVHRKQRAIVRAASRLEVREVESERAALLLENELIRTLRPALNVAGKFDFLYPSLGLGHQGRTTLLCFSTKPEAFASLPLDWFGCFRSRVRAREAFDACAALLAHLGHAERVPAPRVHGSSVRGFRQIDGALRVELAEYLAGNGEQALRSMARALLDKPAARREAATVNASLKALTAFHATDLAPLRDALRADGRDTTHVHPSERDALFLRTG